MGIKKQMAENKFYQRKHTDSKLHDLFLQDFSTKLSICNHPLTPSLLLSWNLQIIYISSYNLCGSFNVQSHIKSCQLVVMKLTYQTLLKIAWNDPKTQVELESVFVCI